MVGHGEAATGRTCHDEAKVGVVSRDSGRQKATGNSARSWHFPGFAANWR
jgi:hypothetical protein